MNPSGLREAAVLVPLWRDTAGAWRLVVVRRTEFGVHSGQLAFPGGARDARAHAHDLLPPGWEAVRLPYYRVGPHRLWGASERIPHPLLARMAEGEWLEFRT